MSSSRGLDALSKKAKSSTVDLPIESVSLSLQDLIGYFHPPDEHLEHEDKQNRLRALKNRQNLFQEEVLLSVLLLIFHHVVGKCSFAVSVALMSNLEYGLQWGFLSCKSQTICYIYDLLKSVDFPVYLRKYIQGLTSFSFFKKLRY